MKSGRKEAQQEALTLSAIQARQIQDQVDYQGRVDDMPAAELAVLQAIQDGDDLHNDDTN